MNESESKEINASNGKEIDFAAVRQCVDALREYEAKSDKANRGEEDGWVDWPDFKTAGLATKLDANRVKIYEFDSDSWCTVNVSRYGLPVDDAEKFFSGLLSLIREAKKG